MGKRGVEVRDKREGNNGYAIGELADQAGVTPRTVRFYVAEGLLPPPEGAGRAALYTADHLRRLELIKLLKKEFLPLAQIRDLLAGLSRVEIEDLLVQKRKPAPPPQPESAREYIQVLLQTGAGVKERPAMLRQVVASRKRPAAVPSPPPGSKEAAPASGVEPAVTWGRISLHPDVELSVRQSPTDPRTPARVQQLLAVARRLFNV